MRVSSMSAKHLPQDEQFLGHRRRHRAKEADRRSARDGGGKRMRQEWQGEKPPSQFAQSHLREYYREEEHSAMSQV
jgi:hypothetical protein